MENSKQEKYWTGRYNDGNTGWDIGYPSTPIKEFIDQIDDKSIRILIPGAGNAYEAEYLHNNGFKNVYILDISAKPLVNFRNRVKTFPEQNILQEDFFEHVSTNDLILEQTFFCSMYPTKENRQAYAMKMAELLNPKGKLVGLWFNHPLHKDAKRPFGGTKEEYLEYLEPFFTVKTFENCFNSIKPRMAKELFGIFEKKEKKPTFL